MQAVEPVSNSNFASNASATGARSCGLGPGEALRTAARSSTAWTWSCAKADRGPARALTGGEDHRFLHDRGLREPNGGSIDLGGRNITGYPMYRRANLGLGYLAQEPAPSGAWSARRTSLAILEFQDLSVDEQHRRAESLLEEFPHRHLADHRADTLSGGERRRLEIARSLAIDPTSCCSTSRSRRGSQVHPRDPDHNRRAARAARPGRAAHRPQRARDLAIADRVVLMFDGKVRFDGTPEAFAADPDVRTYYLGSEFQL